MCVPREDLEAILCALHTHTHQVTPWDVESDAEIDYDKLIKNFGCHRIEVMRSVVHYVCG